MLRKATRTPREGATARAAGAIAVALVLAAGAPGAQAQSAFVAIDFTTATTSGNAQAGRTAGTFTSTGRVRDAGRMTTAYRAVGTQVDATAMLMGTRGILTIGLRGALGPILDGHQSVAGRWRVCGGTGPYLRLAGKGRWQAVTQLGADDCVQNQRQAEEIKSPRISTDLLVIHRLKQRHAQDRDGQED